MTERFDWAGPVITRPLLVCVASGLVVGLLTWRIGPHATLPAYVYLGVLGVVLSFVDIALERLPDLLTLPSYPIGAALLGLAALVTPQGPARFQHALLGMAVYFLLYAVQWLIVPSFIGLGDVKLAGVLGLYLGWLGEGAWIAGVACSVLLGGLVSFVLLATRRIGRKGSVPYGPFMLAGALLSVLVYS